MSVFSVISVSFICSVIMLPRPRVYSISALHTEIDSGADKP